MRIKLEVKPLAHEALHMNALSRKETVLDWFLDIVATMQYLTLAVVYCII